MLPHFAKHKWFSDHEICNGNVENDLYAIYSAVFNAPDEECLFSHATGIMTYSFNDSKLSVWNRRFFADKPLFKCHTKLQLDDTFLMEGQICTLRGYEYFSVDSRHYTRYKLDDIRKHLYLTKENSYCYQPKFRHCIFSQKARKGAYKRVPTLSWIALIHFHKLPVSKKHKILNETCHLYQGNESKETDLATRCEIFFRSQFVVLTTYKRVKVLHPFTP